MKGLDIDRKKSKSVVDTSMFSVKNKLIQTHDAALK